MDYSLCFVKLSGFYFASRSFHILKISYFFRNHKQISVTCRLFHVVFNKG